MRKHVEESVAPGAAAGGGRGGRLSAGRKRETDSCAGSSSDRCLRFLEKPGPSQPRSVRFAFREPKTSESRIPSHTWFGRLPRRGHAPRGCGLGLWPHPTGVIRVRTSRQLHPNASRSAVS